MRSKPHLQHHHPAILLFMKATIILSATISSSFSLPQLQLNDDTQLKLNCNFSLISYKSKDLYTCVAVGLTNHRQDAEIVDIIGKHEDKYDNSKVEVLVIENQNISFIPNKIGDSFENLVRLEVINSNLVGVLKRNFEDMSLKILKIEGNSVTDIPGEAFEDLTDIEAISLNGNKIEKLRDNLLEKLKNLHEFSAKDNKIMELNENLFKHNIELKTILLSNNTLMKISPKITKHLNNLETFDFGKNPCLGTASSLNEMMIEASELENTFAESCSGSEKLGENSEDSEKNLKISAGDSEILSVNPEDVTENIEILSNSEASTGNIKITTNQKDVTENSAHKPETSTNLTIITPKNFLESTTTSSKIKEAQNQIENTSIDFQTTTQATDMFAQLKQDTTSSIIPQTTLNPSKSNLVSSQKSKNVDIITSKNSKIVDVNNITDKIYSQSALDVNAKLIEQLKHLEKSIKNIQKQIEDLEKRKDGTDGEDPEMANKNQTGDDEKEILAKSEEKLKNERENVGKIEKVPKMSFSANSTAYKSDNCFGNNTTLHNKDDQLPAKNENSTQNEAQQKFTTEKTNIQLIEGINRAEIQENVSQNINNLEAANNSSSKSSPNVGSNLFNNDDSKKIDSEKVESKEMVFESTTTSLNIFKDNKAKANSTKTAQTEIEYQKRCINDTKCGDLDTNGNQTDTNGNKNDTIRIENKPEDNKLKINDTKSNENDATGVKNTTIPPSSLAIESSGLDSKNSSIAEEKNLLNSESSCSNSTDQKLPREENQDQLVKVEENEPKGFESILNCQLNKTTALETQIAEKDGKISDLESQIANLNEQLNAKNMNISSLEELLKELQNKINNEKFNNISASSNLINQTALNTNTSTDNLESEIEKLEMSLYVCQNKSLLATLDLELEKINNENFEAKNNELSSELIKVKEQTQTSLKACFKIKSECETEVVELRNSKRDFYGLSKILQDEVDKKIMEIKTQQANLSYIGTEMERLNRHNDDLMYQINECNRNRAFYDNQVRSQWNQRQSDPNQPESLSNSIHLDIQHCKRSLQIFSTFPISCKIEMNQNEKTCVATEVIAIHRSMALTVSSDIIGIQIQKLQIIDSFFKFFTNDIFNKFQNLKSLEIINSKFSDLAEPKIQSGYLRNLRIEGNSLDVIPNDAFKGCSGLESLILTKNGIKNIKTHAFSDLSSLKKLDLKDNEIEELNEYVFAHLKALTHLSMANNKLKELSEYLLAYQTQLEVVKFDGNHIIHINDGLLDYSMEIWKVDFNGTCVGDEGYININVIKDRIRRRCSKN